MEKQINETKQDETYDNNKVEVTINDKADNYEVEVSTISLKATSPGYEGSSTNSENLNQESRSVVFTSAPLPTASVEETTKAPKPRGYGKASNKTPQAAM